jgi:A/G-specific adenine glycosylase
MPESEVRVLTGTEHVTRPSVAQGERLRKALLAWYAASCRDLPWRNSRDPWAIWVSEVMLQQTRVETVTPYYVRFLDRFPTPRALSEAPESDVLAAWSGLGYYRRARMLHAGAKAVAGGTMPSTREGLLALPGIGPYTAGAIASIAFEEPVGLVDGNVARVFARIFALEDDMKREGIKKAQALASTLVDRARPGDWNQALMELGATVCTPRSPACDRCPVASLCRAHAEDRAHLLPIARPKAKPKPERITALVASRGALVLLARRRSEGLFGGLWEPPVAGGGAAAKRALFAAFGAERAVKVGRVVHVLTHRRLIVDVWRAELRADIGTLPEPYEAAGFFDDKARERLGMATFARKVLAAAGDATIK